ncbi:unnamed protein product, partial [Tilletia caries]
MTQRDPQSVSPFEPPSASSVALAMLSTTSPIAKPKLAPTGSRSSSTASRTAHSSSKTITAFPASTTTWEPARTAPATEPTAAPHADQQLTVTPTAHSSKRLPTSPITPLLPGGWREALRRTGLARRYPTLVSSISFGFDIGILPLHHTQTPPNHRTARDNPSAVQSIIQKEVAAGRYGGPFSRDFVFSNLGHFQTSPLGLVPKDITSFRL